MMPRQEIIERTLAALSKLPADKAEQVADFAAYVLMKHEDRVLNEGIMTMAMEPGPFDFLQDEEDLYTTDDLKERYP